MMWQSQVTEYFQGRKRNTNFQPSKRQKVEVELRNSGVPKNGTLPVSKAPSNKKTDAGVVQTKSTTVTSSSKKHNTRSRIPGLQNYTKSRIVRLNDIWPKSCDTTFTSHLITDAESISTKLSQKSSICPSASSNQLLNVTQNRKSSTCCDDDASVTTVDTTSTASSDKLPVSPSKRRIQSNEVDESETSTVSDVATAVIDDHGNSHPCTPSKRRTVEPGFVSAAVNNKRGRCILPSNSSNYYQTPQKFDFSPYQSNTSTQRSSSARKKLHLSNVDVTKSPPVFVFKAGTEKSLESPVAIELKEKSTAEVLEKAEDVTVESSDKGEHDNSTSVAKDAEPSAETAVSESGSKEVKTSSKNASSVVRIGTCRNLEQLKKKLQDLSPCKAKASGTDVISSASKRYICCIVVNTVLVVTIG